MSVFTLTLDCADGNIARIKQTSSIRGVYLDRLVHNIAHPLFFLVVGFAFYLSSDRILYVIVFIIAAILSELSPLDVSRKDTEALFIRQLLHQETLNYDYKTHQAAVSNPNSAKTPTKPSTFSKVVKTILTIDMFYVTILLDLLIFKEQYFLSSSLAVFFIVGMIYSKSSTSQWEETLEDTLKMLSGQKDRSKGDD